MDKESLKQIKNISIIDYLSSIGINFVNKTGSRHSYNSPFRNENHPSFVVYDNNTWYDWGQGTHGDVISLVMGLNKCSFIDAINILNGNKSNYTIHVQPNREEVKKPSIEILSVSPIVDDSLIEYMCDVRKIDYDVLFETCGQALYTFPKDGDNNKKYSAVSFKNDLGGYELRNSFLKISSAPKCFTTKKHGDKNIYLFEGFVNYLTYLSMGKTFDGVVYILNGVGMMHILMPFIDDRPLYSYVDNDHAGDNLMKLLYENGKNVIDKRYEYEFYNDINEKHMTITNK